jgi:hypothetical protein
LSQEQRSAPTKETSFFFISSDARNSDVVCDICEEMNYRGIPICYDNGTPSDKKSQKHIDARIRQCRALIVFITKNGSSQNYQLRQEYVAAQKYRKPIHLIPLDHVLSGNCFSPEDVVDEMEKIIDFYEPEPAGKASPPHQRPKPKPEPEPEPLPGLPSPGEVTKEEQKRRKKAEKAEKAALRKQERDRKKNLPKEKKPLPPGLKKIIAAAAVIAFLALIGGTLSMLLFNVKHSVGDEISYSDFTAYTTVSEKITLAKSYSGCQSAREAIAISALRYQYDKTEKKMTITGYRGGKSIKKISIPSYIKGKPVRTIGSSAFERCEYLTEIELPDTVTSIEDYAFYGCTRLTQINLPYALNYIGGSAFAYCTKLKEIAIPSYVDMIQSSTFYMCDSLTRVVLPDSLKIIENYAFAECVKLESIRLPDSLEEIYDGAFKNCASLAEVRIPKKTDSIGSEAFAWCEKLSKIYIPPSVKTLYFDAFIGDYPIIYGKSGSIAQECAYDRNYPFKAYDFSDYTT